MSGDIKIKQPKKEKSVHVLGEKPMRCEWRRKGETGYEEPTTLCEICLEDRREERSVLVEPSVGNRSAIYRKVKVHPRRCSKCVTK